MVDQNALDVIKAGAKRLEWVGKLAAELERIGSLEQAAREAETQRNNAEVAAGAAIAQLNELQVRITEAQRKHDADIEFTRNHCNEMRAKTEIECGELLRAAGIEADRLKAAAAAENNRVAEQLSQHRKRCNEEAARALLDRDRKAAERDAAAKELTDLQARIAAAREQARKIIG